MDIFTQEQCDLAELASKQLLERDPHTPLKIEDGRIWRYLGEGEGAHWIQYVFVEELQIRSDGVYARGFKV